MAAETDVKTEAAFTPGPWRVSETMCHETGIYPEGSPVCLAVVKGAQDVSLIAAAPELYAALTAVDAMFSAPGKINKSAVRDRVRTALARARGD